MANQISHPQLPAPQALGEEKNTVPMKEGHKCLQTHHLQLLPSPFLASWVLSALSALDTVPQMSLTAVCFASHPLDCFPSQLELSIESPRYKLFNREGFYSEGIKLYSTSFSQLLAKPSRQLKCLGFLAKDIHQHPTRRRCYADAAIQF